MTTPHRITRRNLLGASCALIAPTFASSNESRPDTTELCPSTNTTNAWDAITAIRANISDPVIPDQTFNIADFDAIGDGVTLNTSAINDTIKACSASGGGRVVIPAGKYLTGAIQLLDNTQLHLSDDAVLLFSQNPADYLPMVQTWFEGVELMNYSPFIYAFNANNVAVTGNGLLDGQSTFDNWWSWRGPRSWKGAKSGTSTGWQPGMPYQKSSRDALMKMAETGTPVSKRRFGDGHYIRSAMIEFNRCNNVLIEGVTVKDAPFWSIHPVLSKNVTARNVTIDNPVGANADGIDPESCNHILIEGCHFDTGDDCISFKSGRNEDGRRIATPCRNAIVRDCLFSSERSALSCGSESSGGVNQIYIENVKAQTVYRFFRIKTNSRRGGVNQHIHIRNSHIEVALENLIEIQTNFSEPLKDDPGERQESNHNPTIKNISIGNVSCNQAHRALFLPASKNTPIQNLQFHCFNVLKANEKNIIANLEDAESLNSSVNGKPLLLS